MIATPWKSRTCSHQTWCISSISPKKSQPRSGMTAARAQPPGPRLPNGRRAPKSWRRKGEDRHRRMPQVAVARAGSVARAKAPASVAPGSVTCHDSGRAATPREETGRSRRKEIIKRKPGSGPFPDEPGGPRRKRGRAPAGMRNRVALRPDCLRTSLTRGGVRRSPSPVCSSPPRAGAAVRAFPPGRLPSEGTPRELRANPIPWSSGFPRVADPPSLRMTSGRSRSSPLFRCRADRYLPAY